ncbi:MAG: response regulator, partial [Lachnospiraceae bacterium]|nr:response regulator [Lachnospiraceae bacterium]
QLFGNIFDGDIMFRECMERYERGFVHAEDREMFRAVVDWERIRAELQEKKTYCVRYRVVREQSVEYYEVKVVQAGTWDGQSGIVLGFRSVDEEIRAEMQKKVILESALAQANRANEAKSVFLSNMSHDIRTPMNAIVGFTTLAITHIDRREQVKEYLEKIMASGNHLLSLINDVLDMSRIESGKMQLEEKVCSLPDVAHGLCNILQADVRAKRQELYVDTVDVVNEEIYCDKLRLNQVLLNLVSNAVKYTPEGGTINVRITEQPVDRDGYAGYVFTVKDTGIGMSEEFLKHVFEPFEREENSTISGIQGTGLGMAITKNIVDMMNGNIEVQSEQGVGTQFDVSFIFRIHVGEETEYVIPELKNCRVLVVDSNPESCEGISHMLGQIGMRAEWATSEEEAVVQSREAAMLGDDFKVYVIGWMLPEIDGIGIARKIREEIDKEAIVIILTAYDWADIEDEAKAAGVTAFCNKPLFLSKLRKCLDSILHGEQLEVQESRLDMSHLKGARILLAEDVDLNQEIAVEILGDAGFVTEVARNGQEAVEMVKRSEPGYYQLVLMDIQMPVMNGYKATKAIRSLKNRKLASIPILAMSANAFEEDKQEALRSGMNGHIAKPIDIESMFETLRKVLKP